MASIPFTSLSASSPRPHIEPASLYSGSSSPGPVKLQIATGGAGESGLLRALAEAFITSHIQSTGCSPFSIAWLKSDTAQSFNYLASGATDVSITYHPVAEEIAESQGFVGRREYGWRDHFMLVGPKSNPAHLPVIQKDSKETTIDSLFSQLFRAASSSTTNTIRFLSRYDKSATNIKESSIWTAIGQVPWAFPYSNWYHQCVMFPRQALEAASRLGEYTLVDRGTWWAGEGWVRQEMSVFMEAGDSKDDVLLNPAHVLVCRYAENREMAEAFADWMVKEDGGQKVARGFEVNGMVLYTPAPASGGKGS